MSSVRRRIARLSYLVSERRKIKAAALAFEAGYSYKHPPNVTVADAMMAAGALVDFPGAKYWMKAGTCEYSYYDELLVRGGGVCADFAGAAENLMWDALGLLGAYVLGAYSDYPSHALAVLVVPSSPGMVLGISPSEYAGRIFADVDGDGKPEHVYVVADTGLVPVSKLVKWGYITRGGLFGHFGAPTCGPLTHDLWVAVVNATMTGVLDAWRAPGWLQPPYWNMTVTMARHLIEISGLPCESSIKPRWREYYVVGSLQDYLECKRHHHYCFLVAVRHNLPNIEYAPPPDLAAKAIKKSLHLPPPVPMPPVEARPVLVIGPPKPPRPPLWVKPRPPLRVEPRPGSTNTTLCRWMWDVLRCITSAAGRRFRVTLAPITVGGKLAKYAIYVDDMETNNLVYVTTIDPNLPKKLTIVFTYKNQKINITIPIPPRKG